MSAPALKITLLALLFFLIHHIAYALPLDLSVDPKINAILGDSRWVETWTASPEQLKLRQEAVTFLNTTIRQTIPLSVGGGQIRLTISNAYGQSDLAIDKVTIAIPLPENGRLLGSGSINTATLQSLTFNGASLATIPRGAVGVSDPVTFNPPLLNGQILSISIYLSAGQTGLTTTAHVYSRTSTAVALGDQTSTMSMISNGRNGLSWYFVNTVEVYSDSSTKALVVLGDSITDGRNSPVNADVKWPSLLSNRVHTTPGLERISIVNQGIGGNQVLTASKSGTVYEEGALSRLNRDILSLSGLGWVTSPPHYNANFVYVHPDNMFRYLTTVMLTTSTHC